jgi:predicted unusual protein kinase regulating ubiquinone biosynthesis (AarF/ABC1/UbiB family)
MLGTSPIETSAFSPPALQPSHKRLVRHSPLIPTEVASIQNRQRYSRLSLSLEDSWDEIAQFVSQAAATSSQKVQPETIMRSIKEIRWEQWFSKEWFAAISKVSYETWQFYLAQPVWIELSVVILPLLTTTLATLYSISFPPSDYRAGMEPYSRGNYDPIQARAYYARHNFLVLQRVLELLRLSNRFLLNLAVDKYIWRDEERMRNRRAQELLELITQLGPTAIKVGQALSVRPDLIAPEYASAVATLQDRVPPFDCTRAHVLLREQLGTERYGHLKGIGLEKNKPPVASASIGQVYRGFIDDKEVAIKVQRPNVLADIALDLHIVREFSPLYQKVTKTSSDLQSLANEWGRGFIAELDYREEALNTIRFNQEMQKRNLNAVCSPVVVSDYSTEQVLVTEWVDGTRLDESDADDVPRLCSVALNAYLVMLLELQSLHCDPHPGNLLRTRDGRLCILDWGMTLDIDPDLQYSLLEYVAHLTSEDYDKLPEDLAKLGFLKPDKLEFARRSGVLEPLKYFLKQAGQGGGAKGVRERIFEDYRSKYPGLTDEELRVEMRSEMKQQMDEMVERESVATGITLEIEELQNQNRDSFQIPEWFLYTSRAFLTLEGVSLQADESFSIIKGCFPYVAKRLVADEDPRARKALRDLIYGASDAVDVDRLSDLADGFSSYTTTTKSVNQQAKAHAGELILANGDVEKISKRKDRKDKLMDTEAAITLAKDSADILLARDGNLVQNLIIEESALAASAQFKDTVRTTFVEGPQRFRESLPLGVGSFLPPLPFEGLLEPFVRKTEQEVKAQALAAKISQIAASPSRTEAHKEGNARNGEATNAILQSLRELEPEQAALVLKELRENVPKYGPLVGQLGERFITTLANTARSNFDTARKETSKSR